jgi:heptaprenylglyceryl phosphate synthase
MKNKTKDIIFYGGFLLFILYAWWILFNIFKWDADKTSIQIIFFTAILSIANAVLAFPFFMSVSRKSNDFTIGLQKYNVKHLPMAWKISIVMSYVIVLYELNIVVIGLLLTAASYME